MKFGGGLLSIMKLMFCGGGEISGGRRVLDPPPPLPVGPCPCCSPTEKVWSASCCAAWYCAICAMEFVTLSTLTEDPKARMTMVSPGSSINLCCSGVVAVALIKQLDNAELPEVFGRDFAVIQERDVGGRSLGFLEGGEE